jgi:hypothetical protein
LCQLHLVAACVLAWRSHNQALKLEGAAADHAQPHKEALQRASCLLQDANVPVKWLSDLIEKYLPSTILEMKKSFSHITPLGTMNFVTVSHNLSPRAALAGVLSLPCPLHLGTC